jgi:hypothetical protein
VGTPPREPRQVKTTSRTQDLRGEITVPKAEQEDTTWYGGVGETALVQRRLEGRPIQFERVTFPRE